MANWFKTKYNKGFRTLVEQMLGLDKAIKEAKGKSVIDLGCAEGFISKEFLKAGAKFLLGIDQIGPYVTEAVKVCTGFKNSKFINLNLYDYIKSSDKDKYDIVLALAIIQKARNPKDFLVLAIESCSPGGLIVIRYPIGQDKGLVKSKFNDNICNILETMSSNGFVSEGQLPGPRGEMVEYWRNVTNNP